MWTELPLTVMEDRPAARRDICVANHRANPESVAANAATNKARDAKRILAWLETQADATCDECEVALGISHQSASARFSDLKASGAIVPGGKRKTRTGCAARAWRVKSIN